MSAESRKPKDFAQEICVGVLLIVSISAGALLGNAAWERPRAFSVGGVSFLVPARWTAVVSPADASPDAAGYRPVLEAVVAEDGASFRIGVDFLDAASAPMARDLSSAAADRVVGYHTLDPNLRVSSTERVRAGNLDAVTVSFSKPEESADGTELVLSYGCELFVDTGGGVLALRATSGAAGREAARAAVVRIADAIALAHSRRGRAE